MSNTDTKGTAEEEARRLAAMNAIDFTEGKKLEAAFMAGVEWQSQQPSSSIQHGIIEEMKQFLPKG